MRVMALIPALDAEETVGLVVRGVLEHVGDVLVVDDGSADRTADEAVSAGANVISHARNMGKGAALKTGFDYALANGYDAVLTLDADTQHDPGEVPKLLEAADKGADIVVGARLREKDKVPRARYYTNMAGVACISWRARQHIEDTQSGFRLYRAGVLDGLRLTTTRFDTESEILIRAGRKGARISCVPTSAIYTEEIIKRSHFRPVSDTYRICMVFLKSFLWSGR